MRHDEIKEIGMTVQGRRIVNPEEKPQQFPEAGHRGIEEDFNGFGMGAVIAIRRVRHVTARVADAGRNHTMMATDQILHSPDTVAGEHCAFTVHRLSSTWSR